VLGAARFASTTGVHLEVSEDIVGSLLSVEFYLSVASPMLPVPSVKSFQHDFLAARP
jgi:hypothetical protein